MTSSGARSFGVHLELTGDSHDKFWQTVVVSRPPSASAATPDAVELRRWGRRGSFGQSKFTELVSGDFADDLALRLADDKAYKSGYVNTAEVGFTASMDLWALVCEASVNRARRPEAVRLAAAEFDAASFREAFSGYSRSLEGSSLGLLFVPALSALVSGRPGVARMMAAVGAVPLFATDSSDAVTGPDRSVTVVAAPRTAAARLDRMLTHSMPFARWARAAYFQSPPAELAALPGLCLRRAGEAEELPLADPAFDVSEVAARLSSPQLAPSEEEAASAAVEVLRLALELWDPDPSLVYSTPEAAVGAAVEVLSL